MHIVTDPVVKKLCTEKFLRFYLVLVVPDTGEVFHWFNFCDKVLQDTCVIRFRPVSDGQVFRLFKALKGN